MLGVGVAEIVYVVFDIGLECKYGLRVIYYVCFVNYNVAGGFYMLKNGCGKTCNPISILYLPASPKLKVLLREKKYQIDLLC